MFADFEDMLRDEMVAKLVKLLVTECHSGSFLRSVAGLALVEDRVCVATGAGLLDPRSAPILCVLVRTNEGTAAMPNTPTISYGDSYTLGQLAKHWEKSHDFVKRMISEDKLVVDERGLVTNAALSAFYKQHAADLDA